MDKWSVGKPPVPYWKKQECRERWHRLIWFSAIWLLGGLLGLLLSGCNVGDAPQAAAKPSPPAAALLSDLDDTGTVTHVRILRSSGVAQCGFAMVDGDMIWFVHDGATLSVEPEETDDPVVDAFARHDWTKRRDACEDA